MNKHLTENNPRILNFKEQKKKKKLQRKLNEEVKVILTIHYVTCLLRNPYASQEATIRTECGTTDRFKIGKGVHQGRILSPYLLNIYAEYIMQNARLEESQAGIKIAGKNINNLRYTDDTPPLLQKANRN